MTSSSETSPNPLRIATWNLDHWKRTEEQQALVWSALRDLRCDVLLAQEVVPPKTLRRDAVVYRPMCESRAWGSAVVALRDGIELRKIDAVRSREGQGLFSMLGTYPGAVIVAQAELPGFGPLTLVSVYGLINTYAQTTMLRVVADLIPSSIRPPVSTSSSAGTSTSAPQPRRTRSTSRGTRRSFGRSSRSG